jgi:hypothetical protein
MAQPIPNTTASTTTASTLLAHEAPEAILQPAGRADLDIQAITDDVWRVRDNRLPEHDALCVLGVIEKKDTGAFEALKVGQGFRLSAFDSFEAATTYFVGS